MKEINGALMVLEKYTAEICTVTEWVELMEYSSTAYFSRKIRTQYRKSLGKIIQQAKLKLITFF